jgi:hypothetical protein
MFNKKTVTPKKIAANQANAKFSTDPRTKRGKRAARLNAVKFGFFSEELVIPLCDGEEALEKYRSLLNAVQQEFQPVGVMQTWYVEKIAESLWRLRRGTRAERGSSLVNLWGAPPYQKDSLWNGLVMTLAAEESALAVLNTAWEEIQQTGTLSAATNAKVAPLVGGRGQTAVKTPGTEKAKESTPAGAVKTPKSEKAKESNPARTVKTQESEKAKESNPAGTVKSPQSENAKESTPAIDNDFLRHIEEKRLLLQISVLSHKSELRNGAVNAAAKSALPPAEDTNKILRYENQMRKQLDWAFKGFDECRKRRKKARR